ncbi:uncharacterized protein LOC105681489 [Bombus impatiens]|uniref:Uncharacterized protein LOC105681489 n=1 Tax=Bombus impatiens TaxID=132113 RepID=A0A6P3V3D6_BOMIM|nr:uncharacterized protein LOC105681489 [Bombus impatiens]
MWRRKMNYLCEENVDRDDDSFDFRIYNDVAVDLDSSYSESSDSDILVAGRRRKIRKLSSSEESADDGEPQEENLSRSICNQITVDAKKEKNYKRRIGKRQWRTRDDEANEGRTGATRARSTLCYTATYPSATILTRDREKRNGKRRRRKKRNGHGTVGTTASKTGERERAKR